MTLFSVTNETSLTVLFPTVSTRGTVPSLPPRGVNKQPLHAFVWVFFFISSHICVLPSLKLLDAASLNCDQNI